jgi:uncharacterized repeat protein (TIGR01451 family)
MSRLRAVCIPILVLAVLALLRVTIVGAAPPEAPLAGITVTPTIAVTPTPASTRLPYVCDPIIRKRVSPEVAQPGEEVLFVISVVNIGREAAADARIIDRVPDYLEILEVQVIPEDQGQELLPRKDQTVLVDLGTLGQDFEAAVAIRARVREDAPAPLCVENVAEFRAPNCPDRSAEVACWQLPESGGQQLSWMVPIGEIVAALGLGLALAKRKRTKSL